MKQSLRQTSGELFQKHRGVNEAINFPGAQHIKVSDVTKLKVLKN